MNKEDKAQPPIPELPPSKWQKVSQYLNSPEMNSIFPRTLYSYQEEALRSAIQAYGKGFDFEFLRSPTGSGKSVMETALGQAVWRALNTNPAGPWFFLLHKTMIVVPNRPLQNQLARDYGHLDYVRSLMGKSNYKCGLLVDPHSKDGRPLTADVAPCMTRGFFSFKGLVARSAESFTNPSPHFENVTDHADHDSITTSASLALVPNLDFSLLDIDGERKFKGTPEEKERKLKSTINFVKIVDDCKEERLAACKGEGPKEIIGADMRAACHSCQICPYLYAKQRTIAAPIAIMNTMAYLTWVFKAQAGELAQPRFLTIFDEAHLLEDLLRTVFSRNFSNKRLNQVFEILAEKIPEKERTINFMDYADPDVSETSKLESRFTQKSVKALKNRLITTAIWVADYFMISHGLGSFKDFFEYAKKDEKALPDDVDRALNTLEALLLIFKDSSVRSSDFIFRVSSSYEEETEDRIEGNKKEPRPQFSALRVRLPEEARKCFGSKTLFLSATIPDLEAFADPISLQSPEIHVTEVKDPIPFNRKALIPLPLHYVTREARLKNKGQGEKDILRDFAAKATEIMDCVPGRALFHSHSYSFGLHFHSYLGKYKSQILIPRNSEENRRMLKSFILEGKNSKIRGIVTPSCKEGVDLKDDLCRLQFFLKCPFMTPDDPMYQFYNKTEKGKRWIKARVATTILQCYGRPTRSAKDWSFAFIFDAAILNFIINNPDLFPVEVHRSLEYGYSLDFKNLVVDGVRISKTPSEIFPI